MINLPKNVIRLCQPIKPIASWTNHNSVSTWKEISQKVFDFANTKPQMILNYIENHISKDSIANLIY